MDMRVVKSKKCITEAFLEIRAKKELRKITVKEVCEKALVNKSTFYSHYNDIFDLSDKIESEMIISIVNSIPHPEYIVENSSGFSLELINAFYENTKTLEIVFSDDRKTCLIEKIAKTLRDILHQKYPEFKNNVKFRVALDYAIFGGYYAFEENQTDFRNNNSDVIDALTMVTDSTGNLIRRFAKE